MSGKPPFKSPIKRLFWAGAVKNWSKSTHASAVPFSIAALETHHAVAKPAEPLTTPFCAVGWSSVVISGKQIVPHSKSVSVDENCLNWAPVASKNATFPKIQPWLAAYVAGALYWSNLSIKVR